MPVTGARARPGTRPRRSAIAAVVLAAACARAASAPDPTLEVLATVRPGAGAASAWVRLSGATAGGASHDAWYELSPSSGGFAASIAAPAGSFLLEAVAFAAPTASPDAAAPDFALAEPVAVDVGRPVTAVAVVLDAADAGAAARSAVAAVVTKNTAPRVTALTAAPIPVDSADPAALLTLAATAVDKEAQPLTYAWTATYSPVLAVGTAPGVFSAPAAASTTWKPPPNYAGTVTFKLVATDPLGASGAMSLAVAVKPMSAWGSVAFTVTVNNFPDVTQLTVSDGQPAPGASATLAVTAVDPDLDPLAYAWDDGGCGGTFQAGAAATATWAAPGATASCRLTVVVRDLVKGTTTPKGGATSSSVTVAVGEPSAALAPIFTTCVSTVAAPVRPGDVVSFFVAAEELAGTPPAPTPVSSFAWDDGTGRAGAFVALAPPATDAVAWTAPACGAATAPMDLTIAATATGSAAIATFPFPIRVSCP